MKIKHICFIVPNYPTKGDPVYTFVRELVVSISRLGIKCSVIAPQSITNFIIKRKRKRPFYWQDKENDDVVIDVYQPIHFPFFNISFKEHNLAGYLTSIGVKYAFNKYRIKPDVLYAHFWHSGIIASEISSKRQIPVFVASGESKIRVETLYSRNRIDRAINGVSGVICVSGKNLEESINLGLARKENAIVIPNAINNELFYKKDRDEVRKDLGFNKEDFIIAFTGTFNHRKGVLRVVQAIENLPDVKALFIGSGEQQPKGSNIVFSGRLPHNQIVNYLNASDVFVLPTLAEGCCNAIIEAMACGLPIISSSLSFNDDILDEKNSIRVDSNSIDEIASAIELLENNSKTREEMAKDSLVKAKELEINNRAKKVIEFIKRTVEKNVI